MKFLYIQNYLKIPREKKLQFFAHVGKNSHLKIKNQKIILNDNSLILELESSSHFIEAKKKIEDFFQESKEIKVETLYKIVQNNSKISLYFENQATKEVSI